MVEEWHLAVAGVEKKLEAAVDWIVVGMVCCFPGTGAGQAGVVV